MATVQIRGLWYPKRGATAAEYEDAFAYDEARGVAALADGASSAYRAGAWARRLVDAFVRTPPTGHESVDIHRWAEKVARGWSSAETAPPAEAEGTWWQNEAQRRGSYATLVGLFLDLEATQNRGSIRWVSVAVGDSCLFQVRDGQLLGSFPLRHSSEFGSRPSLVGSLAGKTLAEPDRDVRSISGAAARGDVFILATDALAEWALRTGAENHDVWRALTTFRIGELTELVASLRGGDAIENDDTTMVRCRVL